MPKTEQQIFDYKKRYIILSGGPSAGKSSIIREIMAMGVPCLPEAARQVIANWQQDDIPLPWQDDPHEKRQGKLLEDDIAKHQHHWLIDLNKAIDSIKNKKQPGELYCFFTNTASIQLTEQVSEALQRHASANPAQKSSIDLALKYLHKQYPCLTKTVHHTTQARAHLASSDLSISKALLPRELFSEQKTLHTDTITALQLADLLTERSQQLAKQRLIQYLSLSVSQQTTIMMDRGLLDPVAFNDAYLQHAEHVLEQNYDFCKTCDELTAKCAETSTLVAQNIHSLLKATQKQKNVLFVEVKPLPRSIYSTDAQRHETYEQAQEQHRNILRAYQPLHRKLKVHHIPVDHQINPRLLSPKERAIKALAFARTELPRYQRETQASMAKQKV